MRELRVVMIAFFALIILIEGVPLLLNPMRRPAGSVQNYVLRRTPLGTDMEDVIALIEKNEKWTVHYIRACSHYQKETRYEIMKT